MSKHYIYALRDEDNGDIRYVGKTNNLRARRKAHKYCTSRNRNSELRGWLNSLSERPLMTVLQVCDESTWSAAEKEWIAYLRSIGVGLLNLSSGGASPKEGVVRKHSEATKERLRTVRQAQLLDDSYRERHRNGVRKWAENLSQEEKDHLAQVGRIELGKHRDKERQSRNTKKYWESLTPEQRKEFCEFRTQRIKEMLHTPEDKERRFAQGKNRANKLWGSMTPESREQFIEKRRQGIQRAWNRRKGIE